MMWHWTCECTAYAARAGWEGSGMLVEFSVGNYRSFRERATLSLVASADKEHLGNAFSPGGGARMSLLKVVGVYGANASGKTNLVRAVEAMRRLVLRPAPGSQNGQPIAVSPFRLDAAYAKKPSEFEAVFRVDGEGYRYGFQADRERIVEEWLSAFRTRERMLFRRVEGEQIRFGPTWVGSRKRLAELTRPNALFLSLAAQLNNPTAKPVFDWFKEKVWFTSRGGEPGGESEYTARMVNRGPEDKGRVVDFLRVADIGIDDLAVKRAPLVEGLEWDALPEAFRAALQFIAEPPDGEPLEVTQVGVVHRGSDGKPVEFSLEDEESAGTSRLFELSGPWQYVMREGCVLFVDEIEAHLHPLITRFLVESMHSSGASQLVFTTHDVSLLDRELLRRDQIWFTEKSQCGGTDLYSLWEHMGVRRDENFRSGYLKGRYGAIPFVGRLGV